MVNMEKLKEGEQGSISWCSSDGVGFLSFTNGIILPCHCFNLAQILQDRPVGN